MLYKILKTNNPEWLVDKTNESIEKGWKPLGGVSIAAVFMPGPVYSSITEYAQALVKD